MTTVDEVEIELEGAENGLLVPISARRPAAYHFLDPLGVHAVKPRTDHADDRDRELERARMQEQIDQHGKDEMPISPIIMKLPIPARSRLVV